MKIQLTISTQTLGTNTDAENRRYCDAVKSALHERFPEYDVVVNLVGNCTSGSCYVSGDDTGEISADVRRVARLIWDNADY